MKSLLLESSTKKHFLLMSKVGLGAEEDNIYFCHCESLNLHSLIAF